MIKQHNFFIKGILFWLFICGINVSIVAQTRVLKGVVTDSLQQPLEFANIMAKAIDQDLPFVFAVTDDKGVFEMRLKTKATYLITASFMGYRPYHFKLDSLVTPAFKRIALKPNHQALDQVVVDYQTPVKITQDSIVYNVKHFVTGKERKLRAVLQELPGVEVNKQGQITVMGKKVQKVMVEGKDFFGGSAHLAVDNIPADAVKTVQVLKDFTAVSFMKGLTEDQKMIINIKLKEGKKRFIFGDIVAGGGNDRHYIGKANLFYYSPKNNLSYIGNANDIGTVSLSFEDMRRFENNDRYLTRRFMPNPAKKSLFNFANKGDFTAKQTLFNALQWQQDFGLNWQFQVYGIWSKDHSVFRNEKENHFVYPQHFTQIYQNDKQVSPETALGKINLIYNPKSNQYTNFSFYINKDRPKYLEYNIDSNPFQNRYVNTFSNEGGLQVSSSLLWYHKFNKKQIIRFLSQYNYNDNRQVQNWSSDKSFLQGFISMQPASEYCLHQNIQTGRHQWLSLLKYYYKIDHRHHIYISLGETYQNSRWQGNLIQQLPQDDFNFGSFQNDLHYRRQDIFTGLQFRFRIGQSILTPGLYLHKIIWQLSQSTPVNKSKYLWLPEFNMDTKWFHGDLKLRYAAKTALAHLQDYIYGKTLLGYNQVFQGNPLLDQTLYHVLNLNYSYFSLAKGITLFSNMHYKKQITQLTQVRLISGTDYYSKPIVAHLPLAAWDVALGFTKVWPKIQLKYKPFVSFSENTNQINQTKVESRDWMMVNDLSVGRYYKTGPELSIGIRQDYMKSLSKLNNFETGSLKPYFEALINYKNIELQSDFYLQYTSESQQWQQTGTLFNASILYQKPDKAFGIALKIINLFNRPYKIRFMNTEFLTAKNTTWLQPRIVMINLHYKL